MVVAISAASRHLEVAHVHSLILHLRNHVLRELIWILLLVVRLLLRLLNMLFLYVSFEGFSHSEVVCHVAVVLRMWIALSSVFRGESTLSSKKIGTRIIFIS